MSGHSKWHNIQKTKGAQDAKRAAAFTKISKEMIVAVKEGGGVADPAYNSRLATVITKAKAANMPNDNIKRVLEKAAAAGSGDDYESITYEGHGPAGIAVIVETMTDNRNRTAGNVRHHFDKFGGSLGTTGCVSWSFDKKGVIVIDNEEEELDEDTVMMDALDAGAADFQPEEGCFTIYTDPADFNAVAKALEEKGYKFESAQIEMVPQTYQKLEKPEDIANMEKCSISLRTTTTSRTSGTTGITRNKHINRPPAGKILRAFFVMYSAACRHTTLAPKGISASLASLKHCFPNGIPTMVMHQRHPRTT